MARVGSGRLHLGGKGGEGNFAPPLLPVRALVLSFPPRFWKVNADVLMPHPPPPPPPKATFRVKRVVRQWLRLTRTLTRAMARAVTRAMVKTVTRAKARRVSRVIARVRVRIVTKAMARVKAS